MNEFASVNLTVGQINALVKKFGGEEAVKAFLRGELFPVQDLPMSGTVDVGLSKVHWTIFYSCDNKILLTFSSTEKEVAGRSIRVTLREWETGKVALSGVVYLKLDAENEVVSDKFEISRMAAYTMEFKVE